MKKLGMIVAGLLVLTQGGFAEEAEWANTVAAGVNITSGNSETLAANASVNAERVSDVNEVRLGASVNFGESEIDGVDQTTTQNAKALAIYKRKFEEFFLYSDNSIFHDDIANIDSRLILGLGIGRRIVETESITFDLELGAAYISEELADTPSDDYVAARVAVRHDQKLSETAKLWVSAEYLPNIDDTDDYLLNGEAGVEAALNSTLSLRLVVQDRYDSTVPAGRENNDLSVISSLVYTL